MPPGCNIFIVRTPFQLFNAIEGKNRFHADENNLLLIIDNGNRSNMEQINSVLECDDCWGKTITLELNTRKQKMLYQFLYSWLIDELAKTTINNIYIAQYRNLTAHIINNVKSKSITLFDDGNNIFRTIDFMDKSKSKRYKFARKAIDLMWRRKTSTDFIYDAKIFTLFDLVGYKNIKNEVIHNCYKYFKSQIGRLSRSEDVYFIGSKVIGNGFSKDTFEKLLKGVILHYRENGKGLVYVPHRYEDVAYLEELSNEMNFSVSKFTTIIEYEFIKRNVLPCNISTFRSTAVDTLHLIFGSEVEVFRCPLKEVNMNKRAEFELVYQNFMNKNYQMVSV
jgi:hypothetical protein